MKSNNIDAKILIELSLGKLTGKAIAKKYGVSESYVSSLKRGKKIPYVNISKKVKVDKQELIINDEDITKAIINLHSLDLISNKESIYDMLSDKLAECIINAKIIQIILNKLKGE